MAGTRRNHWNNGWKKLLAMGVSGALASSLAAGLAPSHADAAVGNVAFDSTLPADGAILNQLNRLEVDVTDPDSDTLVNGGYIIKRLLDNKYMVYQNDPTQGWSSEETSGSILHHDGNMFYLDLDNWMKSALYQDGEYEVQFRVNEFNGTVTAANVKTIRFTLDRTPPGISNAVIQKDILSFDLSDQPGGRTLAASDFDIKVNGEPAAVIGVIPEQSSDHLLALLSSPVSKSDTVTIAYMGQTYADTAGNSVSTAPVAVSNQTPGTFAEAPVLTMKLQPGYALKAGDSLVRFTPSGNGGDYLDFRLPAESGNPPALTISALRKTDFVFRDLADGSAMSPVAVSGLSDSSLGSYELQLMLPDGSSFVQGHSYELVLSASASGDELAMPSTSTTNAEAGLQLLDIIGSPVVLDEYTFQHVIIAVNYAELATAIDDAQTKHDAAVEGGASGNYEAGAKDALQAAIDAAKTVRDDAASTQAEVDAALTALTAAVTTFDGKVVSVDVSALATAIGDAQSKHDVAVEGGASGNYEAGAKDALQTAINAAKLVHDNAASTQAEVDAALTALTAAVTTFDGKVVSVDVSALATAIGDAQSKHDAAVEGGASGNYEAGAKDALQAAIEAAKTVRDDTSSTQAEVDAALTALTAAVTTFDGKVVSVDVSALATAIGDAQSKHDAAVEGGATGEYEAGAKDALQAAIEAAKTVRDDTSSTQAEVDAALTALNAAVATFEGKVVSVDFSALTTAIADAQSKHDTAVEGGAAGEYEAGAKAALQAAIDAANLVRDNASSTQVEVDAALTALNAAVATFEGKVVSIDFSALTTAIADAQSKHDAAVEGGTTGNYEAGSKDALQAAIDAAKAVRDNAASTQAEVDAALTALNAAVATFEGKVVSIDFSALTTAIADAQSKHDAAVEGGTTGNYEAGSKDALQAAIDAAKAVRDNAASTQAEVDAALTALNAAVATFEGKVVSIDFSALTTAIADAQSKHDAAVEGGTTGNYEAGSKDALQAAIDAAKAVRDNAASTQAEVDAALTALNAAVATFEGKVVSIDFSALTTAIADAQSKHDAAVEGGTTGNYEAGSKDALQAAIDVAKLVRDNASSTQGEVDAALTALNAAVTMFDGKVVSVDVAALATAIGDAQSKHDAAIEGGATGEYEVGAKDELQAAIDAAKLVRDNASSTQAEVDAAITALTAAVATFDGKVVSVEVSALATAIGDAQSKHDAAVEGGATGNYEAGSKEVLQAAIDAAKAVRDNASSTQAEVDAAITALNAAVATFDTKKVTNPGGPVVSIPVQSTPTYTVQVTLGTSTESMLVKQKKNADGSLSETLELDGSFAERAASQLKQAGQDRLVISLPQAQTGVREQAISLSSEAAQSLAEAGIALSLSTPDASLSIPVSSLKGAVEPLSYTFAPIRDSGEQSDIVRRANASAVVRSVAGTGDVELIGPPVSIETDRQGHPIMIMLPITDASMLQDAGVYIEHSDGTTELLRGQIVEASGGSGVRYLQFDVNHFSLFAVVSVAGWTKPEAAAALKLQNVPYMSGYAGGLFKPNASVTRAEMAAILSRLAGDAGASDATVFKDVPGTSWAKAAIAKAVGLGLMSGTPQGEFHPDRSITRAEMATIVSRLLPSDGQTGEADSFADTAGHWADAAIRQVRAAGIMSGYTGGKFKPDQALTRAEAVVILNKLIGLTASASSDSLFADVPTAYWAYQAIQAAAVK